jgi:uncharacterized protein (DUF2164 family)
MLNNGMVSKLYELHIETNKEKKGFRTVTKIVIDSITEQICEHFFNTKPNGNSNVRALINEKIDTISEQEDKNVLTTLKLILREYEETFSKLYTDHNTKLILFMNTELKNFCIALANHSYFAGNTEAINLRRLLR